MIGWIINNELERIRKEASVITRKSSVKTIDDPVQIRIKDLSNASLHLYEYTKPLGGKVLIHCYVEVR
jgi:hypothetical protein